MPYGINLLIYVLQKHVPVCTCIQLCVCVCAQMQCVIYVYLHVCIYVHVRDRFKAVRVRKCGFNRNLFQYRQVQSCPFGAPINLWLCSCVMIMKYTELYAHCIYSGSSTTAIVPKHVSLADVPWGWSSIQTCMHALCRLSTYRLVQARLHTG